MGLRILMSIILILGIAGCASTAKNSSANSGAAALQEKISDLENQLQEKDEQINDLEERLSRVKAPGSEQLVDSGDVDMSKATPKNIQVTLKNAGFYSGAIDGKVGRRTRNAIKEFQKSNDLKAHGVVGKQTWAKLQKYLE